MRQAFTKRPGSKARRSSEPASARRSGGNWWGPLSGDGVELDAEDLLVALERYGYTRLEAIAVIDPDPTERRAPT